MAHVFDSKLVVIGGSAGAYRTLETILRDLPIDLAAAVCIVLHVQPSETNWPLRRLAQITRWPVSAPEDEILQAGHVYAAMPDHHLLIRGNRAVATHGPRENMWRPAIDVLFRSAAVWHSTRAIGVLLSGELDDGTSGMQALQACGAATIVQEPTTAEFPTMPSIALANTEVDYRVEAAEIGSVIARLVNEQVTEPPTIPLALRQEVEMADENTSLTTLDFAASDPTPLSCPACGGPLWQRDPNAKHLRCLVGHAYHIGTLGSAVDEALDRTLWAAIRLFEQRAHIAQTMADDARGRNLIKRADIHASRAKEAKQHVARLRELVGVLHHSLRDAEETGSMHR